MQRSILSALAGAVLVGGVSLGGSVQAEPDEGRVAQLEAYFAQVETLQGSFEQFTLDEQDRVVDESSGTFVVVRPNRFHWSYSAPFAQEIVADGERLWIYDVDLEQVTVRNQAAALGSAPAQLLAGDYDSLAAAFHIEPGDGFIRLIPRAGESLFDEARLGLEAGRPKAMEIDDALGQTTRVELFDVTLNESVDEERLRFEPPAGVDVYAADEGEALP